MNRITAVAVAAGLLALPLADASAQAADSSRPRARAEATRQPMRQQMQRSPAARLIAQRERLKLTDQQVARLETIQQKYADLNRPHLEALKAARSDTAGRRRPERPEATRPMTPEQRLERRQQALDRQKAWLAAHPEVSRAQTALAENARKSQEEVQAVLTDEQKALVQQRTERRRDDRRDSMRARPRAPGRPGARRGA